MQSARSLIYDTLPVAFRNCKYFPVMGVGFALLAKKVALTGVPPPKNHFGKNVGHAVRPCGAACDSTVAHMNPKTKIRPR